jgi:hypothetical protein
MIESTQQIYCDESGFGGNNLLHPHQPFFVYASVAVSHEEAASTVDELIRTFGIQGGELKGCNLVKHNRGRQAMTTVLDRFHDRIKVTVYDKKYALACKFFEYIFEPTISEVNSLFYGIGFHKFISNVLHMHFLSEAKYAEEIYMDFQNLMRTYEESIATHLFSDSRLPDIPPVLENIKNFTRQNLKSISEELGHLRGSDIGKWILDLSDASLHTLLSHWAESYSQLDVYCDHSKPLEEVLGIFDMMVGREDRTYFEFGGKKRLLTYNLKDKIKLVDSKTYHGVQLADVAAAAFAYIFHKPGEECSRKWRKKYFLECVHEDSILPDFELVDLSKPDVVRNALLLEELCSRSNEGRSLTEGIGEYIAYITHRIRYDPPSFLKRALKGQPLTRDNRLEFTPKMSPDRS